jgi:hypothetical protein
LENNKKRKLLKALKEQHRLNQLETLLKLHHHLQEIKKPKLHQKQQQPHHQLVNQQLKLNLLLERLFHLQREKLLHHLQENL